MRWDDLEQSSNIEDRRGESGGGGGGLRRHADRRWRARHRRHRGDRARQLGARRRSALAARRRPDSHRRRRGLPTAQSGRSPAPRRAAPAAPSDDIGNFVSRIPRQYRGAVEGHLHQGRRGPTAAPVLVMYRDRTDARLRRARRRARWGPFLLPGRPEGLSRRRVLPRDREPAFRGCDVGSKACQFSQAYVIAHEIGHHVQNLLGILPKVQQQQRGMDRVKGKSAAGAGRAAGRLLCRRLGVPREPAPEGSRAGPPFIEQGDVEAGDGAPRRRSATTTLQRKASGHVVPDSFTHGQCRAAPALVHDRPAAGHRRGVRYVQGGGVVVSLPLPMQGEGGRAAGSRRP